MLFRNRVTFFCSHFLPLPHSSVKYKKANPDNKNVAEVGKAGGLEWASMGAAAKAKYEEQAAKDKAKFAKDYPDYKPEPRAKKAKEGEPKAKKAAAK